MNPKRKMDMIPTPEIPFDGLCPSAVVAATCEDIAATRERALARPKEPHMNLSQCQPSQESSKFQNTSLVLLKIQSLVADPSTAPEHDTYTTLARHNGGKG